jgi:HK97 family phage major capsid protein
MATSIARGDVAGLISDAYATNVFTSAAGTSKVLEAFPTVPMGTKQTNLPVLATVPHAKFVTESGATGVKPNAKATWANKTLVAEEIAVIIPIHESVLDDMTTDGLGEISALGGQAIAYALDAAVLFGTNKPATWTSLDLQAASAAAGQVFTIGAGEDDLAGSVYQAAGAVADAGKDPSEIFTASSLRYRLANLRDGNGALLLADGVLAGLTPHYTKGTVLGDVPVWDAASATALVVDGSQVRIGVRQDLTVKLLTEATLGTGENAFNLAENDHVALRFVARYAYVLADNKAVASVAPAVV